MTDDRLALTPEEHENVQVLEDQIALIGAECETAVKAAERMAAAREGVRAAAASMVELIFKRHGLHNPEEDGTTYDLDTKGGRFIPKKPPVVPPMETPTEAVKDGP